MHSKPKIEVRFLYRTLFIHIINIMANKPSLTDIFSAMTANETIEVAKVQKNPKKLWHEFWIENEVCCLFADANVGKSILAVQISNTIAEKLGKDEHILYYDFELSKKQFELRYTDEKNKSTFKFNDKFISGIEANIQKYNSKVLIVDNISWLTNMKDTATTAGKLMSQLCNLKKRYGASILVLAHTPKRNLGSPLTQNSLSGSKKFTNFFDAMFAVGKSIKDPSIRYVKQIKVRTGAFKYDSNNVELCKIEKRGSFLGFEHIGYSTEEEQLKIGKKTIAAATKTIAAKKGRKSKRVGRSHLAAAQIDLVSQMADEAFEMFSK